MLKKLLKYDFRANLKIFLFIWPAIILLAIVSRFIFQADRDDSFLFVLLKISTFSIFAVALEAACIVSYIITIVRFYSGLFGKEGYLMHTLPVKTWQLILSKFISAIVFVGFTVALCIFAILYQYVSTDNSLVWLKNIVPSYSTGILIFLTMGIGGCMSILQIYFASCLGHLFRRKRVFWSIFIWYGMNVLTGIVMFIVFVLGMYWGSFFGLTEAHFYSVFNVSLMLVLLLQSALCAVFFFASRNILAKRLNLE